MLLSRSQRIASRPNKERVGPRCEDHIPPDEREPKLRILHIALVLAVSVAVPLVFTVKGLSWSGVTLFWIMFALSILLQYYDGRGSRPKRTTLRNWLGHHSKSDERKAARRRGYQMRNRTSWESK